MSMCVQTAMDAIQKVESDFTEDVNCVKSNYGSKTLSYSTENNTVSFLPTKEISLEPNW